jgi:hypothetical protein
MPGAILGVQKSFAESNVALAVEALKTVTNARNRFLSLCLTESCIDARDSISRTAFRFICTRRL